MTTVAEVLLDRKLLDLIDSAEVDWNDDIPDLSDQWSVEELSPRCWHCSTDGYNNCIHNTERIMTTATAQQSKLPNTVTNCACMACLTDFIEHSIRSHKRSLLMPLSSIASTITSLGLMNFRQAMLTMTSTLTKVVSITNLS